MAIDLSSSMVDGSPDESSDPMASIANLVDVMLVFACGLMIALVVAWNADVPVTTEVLPTDELEEIEDVNELDERLTTQNGDDYINLGSVYQDPSTGKYYLIITKDKAEEAEETAEQAEANGTDEVADTTGGTETNEAS